MSTVDTGHYLEFYLQTGENGTKTFMCSSVYRTSKQVKHRRGFIKSRVVGIKTNNKLFCGGGFVCKRLLPGREKYLTLIIFRHPVNILLTPWLILKYPRCLALSLESDILRAVEYYTS
jgi:hypothetical protein